MRYSYRHSHFRALQPWLPSTFSAPGTLPYHARAGIHSFSAVLEPRWIVGAGSPWTSELLRTL